MVVGVHNARKRSLGVDAVDTFKSSSFLEDDDGLHVTAPKLFQCFFDVVVPECLNSVAHDVMKSMPSVASLVVSAEVCWKFLKTVNLTKE